MSTLWAVLPEPNRWEAVRTLIMLVDRVVGLDGRGGGDVDAAA
ncbi:hypothetical protein AB0M44_49865 [Streptosporangium subroseum]